MTYYFIFLGLQHKARISKKKQTNDQIYFKKMTRILC